MPMREVVGINTLGAFRPGSRAWLRQFPDQTVPAGIATQLLANRIGQHPMIGVGLDQASFLTRGVGAGRARWFVFRPAGSPASQKRS